MEISQFKPGDIITRIEPIYWVDELGGSGSHSDGSLIGWKLKFKGIANGCIIVESDTPILVVFNKNVMSLPVWMWRDGWDYWVDPKTVGNKKTRNKKTSKSKQDYENEIKKMVDREDYENAEKLKKEMYKKFGHQD